MFTISSGVGGSPGGSSRLPEGFRHGSVPFGAVPAPDGRVLIPGIEPREYDSIAVSAVRLVSPPKPGPVIVQSSQPLLRRVPDDEGPIELSLPSVAWLRVTCPGMEAVPWGGGDAMIDVGTAFGRGRSWSSRPDPGTSSVEFLVPQGTYKLSGRLPGELAVPRTVVVDGSVEILEIVLETETCPAIEFEVIDTHGESIPELYLHVDTGERSDGSAQVTDGVARIEGVFPGTYQVWFARPSGESSTPMKPMTLKLGPDMDPVVFDI